MKTISNLILAASIVSLAACTESKEAETTTGIGTTPVNFSTPSTTQQASTGTGLNPAHGQPGHRCDIPVGASLSTPVKSATAAPAGITPTPVTTPTTTGNAVAPGTNPPHGQPGHDCSIPVGAPLNK